ncbi:Peptidyl-prolyl cis-trans isomerase-like 3 [Colletotrichum higginsianum IMI 349063]|uniref:Peptidyl-prolyl cis-trans isomerase n=1 Tax=Colletotrichum higginsianum (strain IMI 349063) TaxID=759273 RepID=A0A1B7Y2D1_COLHI|nr:Peptidyl-prolyl cis-trans isomerase-like 3 [Colletotrichum higginsianum IMI 349063]OBR06152.1 Peptidyl-prolyl cis-trans isomerase-like 3 [Colletotrichum higginsianum IMI 349063]
MTLAGSPRTCTNQRLNRTQLQTPKRFAIWSAIYGYQTRPTPDDNTSSSRSRQTRNMSVTLHTNLGDLKIEVFCESVPKTAENFLALCASHYYDDSPIHRMIPKFMAQTGAPANPSPPEKPKGGASIWGGTFEDEIRPALKHSARGVVSMANKGPATNGSQFFVLFDKAPHLDGLNTVFGRVIGDEGMLTLDRIEAVEVDRKNRPKEPVKIERVTVHANPLAG